MAETHRPVSRRKIGMWVTLAVVTVLLINIIWILYQHRVRTIELQIEEASTLTNFNPTFYEIFDKSSSTTCNRLIVVQPFKWHILAKLGKVLLLNESLNVCELGSTPVVEIVDYTAAAAAEFDDDDDADANDRYFETACLNTDLLSILESYTDVAPVYVPFDIAQLQQRPNRFTIFDALNDLFTRFITLEPPHTVGVEYQHKINLNRVPVNKHIQRRPSDSSTNSHELVAHRNKPRYSSYNAHHPHIANLTQQPPKRYPGGLSTNEITNLLRLIEHSKPYGSSDQFTNPKQS